MIAHLGDQSPLTLSELLLLCGDAADETEVMQGVAFWTQRGVVREAATPTSGGRSFFVIEDQLTLATLDTSTADNDEGSKQV